jgi:putative oxidoreductase
MSRIESFLSSSAARDAGATVLRIALGAVFLAHAGAKAFIFTFAGTAQFFEAHGFPGWTAMPVFLVELLGGLALVAGFRTRLVSLALVPVMLGALKPHVANGWMFTNSGGGWEYVAFLILALVTQALVGSGALALDGARERRTAPTGRTASVVG